jgi:hypothetical protein
MTAPHTYFLAMRDYGALGWDTLQLATTHADMQAEIVESFRDGIPAGLTTCQVWHVTPDCEPLDVTEEVLAAIGRDLSARFDAEIYPDEFMAWADSDIQDAATMGRAA